MKIVALIQKKNQKYFSSVQFNFHFFLYVYCVTCHVTCYLSLTPTATTPEPSPATSTLCIGLFAKTQNPKQKSKHKKNVKIFRVNICLLYSQYWPYALQPSVFNPPGSRISRITECHYILYLYLSE